MKNVSELDAGVESLSSSLLFDKLKWMTSHEAAQYLRTSVGQIRNMVWRGQLTSYRIKNRLRFLRKDLDRLLVSFRATERTK